jgi:hypothetical protein
MDDTLKPLSTGAHKAITDHPDSVRVRDNLDLDVYDWPEERIRAYLTGRLAAYRQALAWHEDNPLIVASQIALSIERLGRGVRLNERIP